jgi:hypothetical protein
MWTWILAIEQNLGVAQQVLSVIFYCAGICGAFAAVYALAANRRNQREANARRAYFDYTQIAQRNPRFAFPALGRVDFNKELFDGSREKFEKYEWFLSSLLATVAFVTEGTGGRLTIAPRKRLWRKTAVLQLAYHWKYLEHFRHKKNFLIAWGIAYKRLISEAIEAGKLKYP